LLCCSSADQYLIIDIVEHGIDGEEINFEQFRGKVVYVVNVASHCGYTATNYELLRRLKPYVDQGLEIVIAPCNQFGGQEPGDESTITAFARKQGYQGIILSKADVNGPSSRPLYAYLKQVTGKTHISWYTIALGLQR
jgi:glutathione peroxidase-family protein